MVFPVVMYGCESWTVRKAECQRIDAFELWCWRRLLRVPSNCKEIKPVNPKGNKLWIFTGRTDAKAEDPVFWSSDVNRWLIGKVPDAGKDWRQKEKRASEGEMAGQHHRCKELRQTLGDGVGQVGLVRCSPCSPSRTRLGDGTIHELGHCFMEWNLYLLLCCNSSI